MHLSDGEKRLAVRLKKRQASLIRWRWVGLLAGLVCFGAGVYGLILSQRFFRQPDATSAMALSFIVPAVFGLVGIGTGLLVYVVLHWNGKDETQLLLRLVEELEK